MRIKHLLLAVILITQTSFLFGQKMFTISNASKNYKAKIQVQKCEDETCSGKGTVKLYAKNSSKLIQEFKSGDLYFNLDGNKNPSDKMELYDQESPLVFGDFNFDQSEDVAIRNGNNSGYGGASYDVYVYNITKKQFVKSKELTKLASTNLGMFEVDKTRKRIITSEKSGCCWHKSTEFTVVPNSGLLKVHEVEEDASKGDDFVYVTERKHVNGKWTKVTKKYPVKEYYKQ